MQHKTTVFVSTSIITLLLALSPAIASAQSLVQPTPTATISGTTATVTGTYGAGANGGSLFYILDLTCATNSAVSQDCWNSNAGRAVFPGGTSASGQRFSFTVPNIGTGSHMIWIGSRLNATYPLSGYLLNISGPFSLGGSSSGGAPASGESYNCGTAYGVPSATLQADSRSNSLPSGALCTQGSAGSGVDGQVFDGGSAWSWSCYSSYNKMLCAEFPTFTDQTTCGRIEVTSGTSISCTAPKSSSATAVTSYTSSINATTNTTQTTPAPTVTFSSNPASVVLGNSVTLSWTTDAASRATYCYASGSWQDANKPASGSAVVYPTQASNSYFLRCYGPGGNSVLKELHIPVTLSTTNPGPTVTISPSADIASATINQSITFTSIATDTSSDLLQHWMKWIEPNGDYGDVGAEYETTNARSEYATGSSVNIGTGIGSHQLSATFTPKVAGQYKVFFQALDRNYSKAESARINVIVGAAVLQTSTIAAPAPAQIFNQSLIETASAPVNYCTIVSPVLGSQDATLSTYTNPLGNIARLQKALVDAGRLTMPGATTPYGFYGSLTLNALIAYKNSTSCGGTSQTTTTSATTQTVSNTQTTTQTTGSSAIPASGLQELQIEAILALLSSFGADQTVINNVSSSLRGTAPAATTQTTVQQTNTASAPTTTATINNGNPVSVATNTSFTIPITFNSSASDSPRIFIDGIQSASMVVLQSSGLSSLMSSNSWLAYFNGISVAGTRTITVKSSTGNNIDTVLATGTLTVTAPVTTATAPTVSAYSNLSTVNSGSTAMITWNASTGTSYCSTVGSNASFASNARDVTNTNRVTGAITAPLTVTITCYGTTGLASTPAVVTVEVNTATPEVTFSPSATSVAAGSPVTLTWTSTNNATSCYASGQSDWQGTKVASGSATVYPTLSGYSYSLSCSNSAGTSDTKYVTLSVSGPQALPDLTAGTITPSPATGLVGQSQTFSVNVINSGTGPASSFNNYMRVTKPSGWSTATVASVNSVTSSLAPGASAPTTIQFTPTTAGTYTASICVDAYSAVPESNENNNCIALPFVISAPVVTTPTINSFTATLTSVISGQSSTLTLASVDASSCSVSNIGWESGKTNGTAVVSPSQTITYTATCYGSGSTNPVSRSVTVTVTQPTTAAPTLDFTVINGSLINNGTTATVYPLEGTANQTYLRWAFSDTSSSASCTASASPATTLWSGTKATSSTGSGVQLYYPQQAVDTTYTLTCTGAGGSVTKSVTATLFVDNSWMSDSGGGAVITAVDKLALNTSSPQPASSFSYTWNNNLQIGSPYTNDVRALQTALTLEKVYAGEITGGFYDQTFIAVKKFQQKYGIENGVNGAGFVGPMTRAKLNALY